MPPAPVCVPLLLFPFPCSPLPLPLNPSSNPPSSPPPVPPATLPRPCSHHNPPPPVPFFCCPHCMLPMHAALTSCMALYTPSSSHVHVSTAPVGRIGWAAFACALLDTTGCLTPPLFWYTGGAVMLALLLPRARSGQVTVKKIARWGCQASHVNLMKASMLCSSICS